ncbi:hypothetical protein KP509_08G032400 [Ceratopteris richardii]|uniref:Uncharacterized protein n=1 Tax=Ceratopteris richardii TaxID=49495 RepID=A0A8T2U709_CERRI|nr:hypothetical protein KP509_08G032400 [Ceratopteris richardii]
MVFEMLIRTAAEPKHTQENDCQETKETEQSGTGTPSPTSSVPLKERPKGFQSSWDAKDSQGNDYLYRLGKESANMNIEVGARAGIIDDLFAGNFLGKEGNAAALLTVSNQRLL